MTFPYKGEIPFDRGKATLKNHSCIMIRNNSLAKVETRVPLLFSLLQVAEILLISITQEWLHHDKNNKAIGICQKGWFLLFGGIKSQAKLCYEYTGKVNTIFFLRQWKHCGMNCILTGQICLLEQKVKHLKAAHAKLLLIYHV